MIEPPEIVEIESQEFPFDVSATAGDPNFKRAYRVIGVDTQGHRWSFYSASQFYVPHGVRPKTIGWVKLEAAS